MNKKLEPLKSESLTEIFIAKFEELILSGEFTIGEKLPSERDLARQLGISRPVVHKGLLDLAAKGLVTMVPRVGTIVNDYRKDGSLSMLTSLVNYQQEKLDPLLLSSLLDMRILFEIETARLAARNRTENQVRELKAILDEEKVTDKENISRITELDFSFHHLTAMASGNVVYPLLMNSFKKVYTNLSGQFFKDPTVAQAVFSFHLELVAAIENRDESKAVSIMGTMLAHGEDHLHAIINKEDTL